MTDLHFWERMKKYRPLIWGLFIFFVLSGVSASVLVQAHGQKWLVEKVSETLGEDVEVKSIHFIWPLGLRISDLKVGEYFESREMMLPNGLLAFLRRDLNFSSVIFKEPKLTLVRTKERKLRLGRLQKEGPVPDVTPAAARKKEVSQSAASGKQGLDIFMARFHLEAGALRLIDLSFKDKELVMDFHHVDLSATEVSFPIKDNDMNFSLRALLGPVAPDLVPTKLTSSGWLNVPRKNMKAEAHVENITGALVSAYSSNDLMRMFKNSLGDLQVWAESKDNEMKVRCQLAIKKVLGDQETQGEEQSSVQAMLLSGLQKIGQEMALEFQFSTHMDHFAVESVSFSGKVLQPPAAEGGTAPLEGAIPPETKI